MGGCFANRSPLQEPVSPYRKVDDSIMEEKISAKSSKRTSSTIVGENRSKRSSDVNMLKLNKEQSTKCIGTESTVKKFDVESKPSSISDQSQKTEIDGTLNQVGKANVASTSTPHLQNSDISNLVAEYSAVDNADKPDQHFQEVKTSLVLNISKAMSYNYYPTNSPSDKLIAHDFLQARDITLSKLSWQTRALDDFLIPELRADIEKLTINRNINVSFMPEELNVRPTLSDHPTLIRPDNLECWSKLDIESTYDEMCKELHHLVDDLHEAEDLESDGPITGESSSFLVDYHEGMLKEITKDTQNDNLLNEMTGASSEGQSPDERIDNERNVPILDDQSSLIRPDNLEMWSDARIESEAMEMKKIFRALSATVEHKELQSDTLAKTSYMESGSDVDYEIEENVKTDLEHKQRSNEAFVLSEVMAEVPKICELVAMSNQMLEESHKLMESESTINE